MTQTVNVPGVGTLSFPDGMSQPDMAAAIQKNFPELGQPKTSAAGAALHGAERSVGPAAAALVGAGIGQAAIPIPVVGAVVGAAGAAWAANKAQEKALESMPKVAKALGQDTAQRQAEEQQHPIASAVGEIAPQLAAFRPNISSLARAVRSTEGLSEEAAKAVVDARKFAAVNATLGGVQSAAQQKLDDSGQPINWKDVGLSAGLGATLTEPTRLGNRLIGAGEALIPRSAAAQVQPATPAPPQQPSSVPLPRRAEEQLNLPLGSPQQPGQQLPLPLEEPAAPAPQPTGEQLPLPLGKLGQQDLPLRGGSANPPAALPSAAPVTQAAPASPQMDLFKPPQLEKQLTLPFESGPKQASLKSKADVLKHIQDSGGTTKNEAKLALGLKDTETIGYLNTLRKEGSVIYDASTRKWVPNVSRAEHIAGGTGAGMDMPVQQPAPDIARPQEAVAGRVDTDTAGAQRPTGGEEGKPAALEPEERDIEKEKIVRRAVIAFQKRDLTVGQLQEIKAELGSGIPDYGYLNQMLEAASGIKSRPKATKEAAAGPPVPPPAVSAEDQAMRDYFERRQAEDAASKRPALKRTHDAGLKLDIGTAEGEPLTKEAAQNIVDEHTAGWTNKPDIQVHKTTDTLPSHMSVPDTTRGVYDRLEGKVHLIAGNLSPSKARATLFHESLGHYGLEQLFNTQRQGTMGDIYRTNPTIHKAADTWLKYYGDDPFYEGRAQSDMQALATEEVLAKISERGPLQNSGLKAAFNKFAAFIRSFARRFGDVKYSDNDVAQILQQAHAKVTAGRPSKLAGMGAALSAPPTTLKAAMPGPRTLKQIEEDRAAKAKKVYKDSYGRESIVKRVVRSLTTHEGREETIRLLQDFHRPFRTLQENINRSGGNTDIYDELKASSAQTEMNAKPVMEMRKQVHEAIGRFANRTGMKIADVLNRFHTYAIALHEPERRWQKYIENVPLENTKKFNLNGKMGTAADHRNTIMEKYYNAKGDITAQGKADHATLSMLAKTYADKDGFSPAKSSPKAVDPNGRTYDVLGPYTRADIQEMQRGYQDDHAKYGKEMDEVFNLTKKIQDETIKLNKEANYHPQQVSNIISLYDWQHYMPFKGDPNVSHRDNRFERDSKHLSGELNNFAEATEGRHTDSENPLLQTMADAARAASRAGRKGVTPELARLIDTGQIAGRQVKTIPFAERQAGISKQDIDGRTHIFNYLSNGDVQIYKIHDPRMLEAAKGFNGDIGAIWKGLNAMTSAIGQVHTRWNIAFPPYNFVRHALTSSMMVGAENDPGLAAKFLGSITSKIIDGGLFKAGKVAQLFHSGNLSEIERLAQKDPFYANVHDWLTHGGRATWTQGLSIKSNLDSLSKDLGPKGFMSTFDHVQKYFNIWSDMFEFASRSAGYGVMKDRYLAEAKAAGKDIKDPAVLDVVKLKATQYTKNLFNFTDTGKYGREAGSAFMFLRPAMTTAVRSIDALSPAFRDVGTATKYFVKGTPGQADPEVILKKQILPEMAKNGANIRDPQVLATAQAQAKAQAEKAVKAFQADHLKRQKSARVMATGMMGAGYTLYMMSMLGAGDDDQGRNKTATDNMQLWSHNIRLPSFGMLGKDNDWVQIPWGWGLGAFGALGAQIAGATLGQSNFKEAITNMIPIALESYFPIPVPRFNPTEHPLAFAVDTVTPSFARPFIEYGFNVDEFGREIYNDRMGQFGDAYAGGESLPELYGMATRTLADATEGQLSMSPKTLYFFANSYMDGLARMAHNTVDVGMAMTGQKDFDPKRDLGGVFDSFIGKSSSFDSREFYDAQAGIEKQENILNMYKERDPDKYYEYLDNHPNALMIDGIYNTLINGQLKAVRHQINVLQDDTSQSPKDKSDDLQDLRSQRDWIMRSFLDQVEDYSD